MTRKPAARPSRAEELRADYERLGVLLGREVDGTKASALARERRMIGELLETLESPEVVPLVDQLAERRASRSTARPPARRRKSG